MPGNLNPRIVGACLVGFAMVAGAFTFNNFAIEEIPVQTATVTTANPNPRVAIAVQDEDQNGVEDWRDSFVDTEPIVLDPVEPAGDYVAPDTLTGQLGVNFIESYLRAKTYGSFGRDQDELISDTVDVLATETAHDLFDTPDITLLTTWEDADILTYANTLALTITNNNLTDSEGELYVLAEVLEQDADERVADLERIAASYQAMRDETIATPVPRFLQKEHLDLINTYHAIYKDIEAMTIVLDDPAFSLMRIKRYEDDAAGLGYALENMYNALVPYASLVGPEDPALLFVAFSPEFRN